MAADAANKIFARIRTTLLSFLPRRPELGTTQMCGKIGVTSANRCAISRPDRTAKPQERFWSAQPPAEYAACIRQTAKAEWPRDRAEDRSCSALRGSKHR